MYFLFQQSPLPPLLSPVHPVARDHPRRRPRSLLARRRHRHCPLRLYRVSECECNCIILKWYHRNRTFFVKFSFILMIFDLVSLAFYTSNFLSFGRTLEPDSDSSKEADSGSTTSATSEILSISLIPFFAGALLLAFWYVNVG